MASSLMSPLLRAVACRRQLMTGELCGASQTMFSRLPTRTVEPFSLDQPSCLSSLEDLPLSHWIEERLLPLRDLDIT